MQRSTRSLKQNESIKSSEHRNYNGEELIDWQDLLEWQKDNEYILTGYRRASFSAKQSLRTISRIHNETINIWSHMLGAGFFLLWPTYCYFHFSPFYDNASPSDKRALFVFFTGVTVCFVLSSAFHTFSNHSKEVWRFVSHLDHLGIVIVMWASTIPSDHFGFYCSPRLRALYEVIATITALGCAVFTMSPKFRSPVYRPIRVAMYSFLGLSAFIPVAHGVLVNGWALQNEQQSVTYFMGLGLLNFTGAAIYAARIPERWYPGTFDIYGSSHQIMHVLVMCGAWSWTRGLVKAFDYWHFKAAAHGGSCSTD